jgi:hypothetical protein
MSSRIGRVGSGWRNSSLLFALHTRNILATTRSRLIR